MHSIVLFDGVCNLCNRSIQFIIEKDERKVFHFASLQSDFGQALLKKHQLPINEFDSMVLLENEKVYLSSSAALRIARKLTLPWSLLYVFIIIPPFIRNVVYRLIANNRYKWFGKEESCWLPTPALKERFLG